MWPLKFIVMETVVSLSGKLLVFVARVVASAQTKTETAGDQNRRDAET